MHWPHLNVAVAFLQYCCDLTAILQWPHINFAVASQQYSSGLTVKIEGPSRTGPARPRASESMRNPCSRAPQLQGAAFTWLFRMSGPCHGVEPRGDAGDPDAGRNSYGRVPGVRFGGHKDPAIGLLFSNLHGRSWKALLEQGPSSGPHPRSTFPPR